MFEQTKSSLEDLLAIKLEDKEVFMYKIDAIINTSIPRFVKRRDEFYTDLIKRAYNNLEEIECIKNSIEIVKKRIENPDYDPDLEELKKDLEGIDKESDE